MMKPILFVLALLPLELAACRSNPAADAAAPAADATIPSYAAKTSSGEVSFELTPRMQGSRLVINVHSDTHSGDLAEIDLAKTFTLEVSGKSFKPVETKPLGGHHSDGFVAFDVGSAPSAFSLTISGVRSSPDTTLKWP